MAVDIPAVREIAGRAFTREEVLDACERRDLGAVITVWGAAGRHSRPASGSGPVGSEPSLGVTRLNAGDRGGPESPRSVRNDGSDLLVQVMR